LPTVKRHTRMDNTKHFDFSDPSQIKIFRKHIYSYFSANGRELPWRVDYNPYHIYVSEVMLQQTQVDRVCQKFSAFITRFPDFQTLADSRLEEVYSVWQGLGYNRRAAALRNSAKLVISEFQGTLPDSPEQLVNLPGIGSATAASITAFAYNKPMVFLETNIRTVYIHHFFADHQSVNDSLILPVADIALDRINSRKWYSALMDYGTMLKKEFGNLTRKSSSYKKQTPFIGSKRQIRGGVIKLLIEHGELSAKNIKKLSGYEQPILDEILGQLAHENIVRESSNNCYSIAE
jgi:A/G-specific adenine glycosylase